jgi:uncharacterized protein YlzI (FlbEa/FlbD family)
MDEEGLIVAEKPQNWVDRLIEFFKKLFSNKPNSNTEGF